MVVNMKFISKIDEDVSNALASLGAAIDFLNYEISTASVSVLSPLTYSERTWIDARIADLSHYHDRLRNLRSGIWVSPEDEK